MQKINSQHNYQLEMWNKSDLTFKTCFAAIGGLFHPEFVRKLNKALYLYGAPSSFKTFLLKTLFEKLVGMQHVDTLSRTNNRFNLSILKKDDGQPFICFFDDLRWDTLGLHKADFLNLLDGHFVPVEEKFRKGTVEVLKATIAVTTNEKLGMFSAGMQDTPAFETRFTQIQTFPLNIPGFLIPHDFHLTVQNEMIAFAILANAFFLSQNKAIKEKEGNYYYTSELSQ